MTSDKKMQSSPKPMRLVDERDPVFASIDAMTLGLSPAEASKKKIGSYIDSTTPNASIFLYEKL